MARGVNSLEEPPFDSEGGVGPSGMLFDDGDALAISGTSAFLWRIKAVYARCLPASQHGEK